MAGRLGTVRRLALGLIALMWIRRTGFCAVMVEIVYLSELSRRCLEVIFVVQRINLPYTLTPSTY